MPEYLRPGVFTSYRNVFLTLRDYLPALLAIAAVFSILSVVPQIVDGLIDWAAPQAAARYAGRGTSDPISVIAGFAYAILVVAPLSFSMAHVYLTAGRGHRPSFAEFFTTARKSFGSVVRGSLLVVALSLAISVLTVLFGGMVLQLQVNGLPLGWLGLLGLILFALFVVLRLAFVPYFVVDFQIGIIEAIGESWEATRNQALRIIAIMLIAGLLSAPLSGAIALAALVISLPGGALSVVAGPILSSLATVPAMVLVGLALASLYEQVAGEPSRVTLQVALA